VAYQPVCHTLLLSCHGLGHRGWSIYTKLIGLQGRRPTASGGYTDTLIAPTGGGAAGHVPSRKRACAAPLASDLLFANRRGGRSVSHDGCKRQALAEKQLSALWWQDASFAAVGATQEAARRRPLFAECGHVFRADRVTAVGHRQSRARQDAA
jgi:hypothetical protein